MILSTYDNNTKAWWKYVLWIVFSSSKMQWKNDHPYCNKHEPIKSFSAFHWIWTHGLCFSIARIRNLTSDIRLESDVPLNVVVLNFAKTELVKWQLLRNSKSQNVEFSKCRKFQNVEIFKMSAVPIFCSEFFLSPVIEEFFSSWSQSVGDWRSCSYHRQRWRRRRRCRGRRWCCRRRCCCRRLTILLTLRTSYFGKNGTTDFQNKNRGYLES